MAKGDDAAVRKKNRATRKKLKKNNDSSAVSARIASIIAAKKRRKSGKRRICQGMCFSLPTPEDPFNDRLDKVDFSKKKTQKVKTRSTRLGKESYDQMVDDKQRKEGKKTSTVLKDGNNLRGKEVQSIGKDGKAGSLQKQTGENMDGPSKFLMLCLHEIECVFRNNGTYNDQHEKPLFMNTWGVEFLNCFLSGKDILDTSGKSSTAEQIAWIASTAADAMARKEKEGLSISNPFLIFLVPSQVKASKVRSVCKPLKSLGLHTVSLHPGASLNHQINGLKSCEPEFLVSTPERLLELHSLKGIDISRVSLLVIDEFDSLCSAGYLNAVKSIKQAISGKHWSVVFSDCMNASYALALWSLLSGPISRLALSDSVDSQSTGIIQSVNICASDEERLQKCTKLLDTANEGKFHAQPSEVVYVIRKDENLQKLRAILKLKGYSISAKSNYISEAQKSGKPSACMVSIEHLGTAGLEDFEIVILPDFVPSIGKYIQILTGMARHSFHGVLQSFLTKEDAPSAGPLVKVLDDCGQTIPEALRNLSAVSSSL